jgi:hypothetical protein
MVHWTQEEEIVALRVLLSAISKGTEESHDEFHPRWLVSGYKFEYGEHVDTK